MEPALTILRPRFVAAFCAALLGAGCAAMVPDAERIQVQQGNLLSPGDIAQLETGLTRSQVRERVGAPILAPTYRPDRWDYVYYRSEAGREPDARQRLTLHFDERDRVSRIENRYDVPEDPLAGQDTEVVPKVDTGGKLPVRDDDRGGPRGPQ